MPPSITNLAEEWLRLDEDRETRDEIYKLLLGNKHDELESRLRNRIAFGTAGLRARMEAGFSRMNSLTVIQASQGLAAYILQTIPEAQKLGIVLGRDARHKSEQFARLTAAAFVAKGIKVWWFEKPAPTPLVPFAVGELHAAAGIVITASHNPAADNGYKVYWQNGCQIIPPHDTGIAKSIEENLEPITWDTSVIDDDNLLVKGCLNLVLRKYCNAVRAAAALPNIPSSVYPRFAYTPMHGVGLQFMEEIMDALDLRFNMVRVVDQSYPDGDFPTVPFPNPEEKGALDLAIKTADVTKVHFILATDPDADRLAVAEKVDGKWHQFTGNELGILLAAHVHETYEGTKESEKQAMLASTVSSQMLSAYSHAEGIHFQETLTGFKWLGNKAIELQEQGYHVLFAFEEAIGYMVPKVVKDKDGLSAAAVFLSAVARWQMNDAETPYHKLQKLFKKYGHFEDANTYLISPSPETTNTVFSEIRALGSPHPSHLGKHKIARWRDLTAGYDSATKDHVPDLPVSKDSQMITCDLEPHFLEAQVRFTVRGSGTEPKIKLYIEGKAGSAEKAKRAAEKVLEDLLTEWFKPATYGLKLA
ncbi:hypothetical protein EJ05DRAFT_478751 [Pseudovirgaria hyperparasitica]|uniref:Phosphoglucomutase-2 n=1 Tax=Pseudovirgaria hyperparasitica TaxID=470096 RepID=A0A6A6VYS7_9PEZI|nr:uncharacterized protein EJ05DRAFT_478751 [Pseudovirgaria hyperparasitica]KAF2755792.1 hypothetical protein EJ05DRAFT_478751 [Pseudovirgaria hyperparasitica]